MMSPSSSSCAARRCRLFFSSLPRHRTRCRCPAPIVVSSSTSTASSVRFISSSSSYSSPSALLSSLLHQAHFPSTPLYPLPASSISFLREPTEFYHTLFEAISRCRDRLTLSALYLGHGPLEQALVQHITTACAKHPHLRVRILLDHSRGTRGHRHHASSLTTLAPLLSLAHDRSHDIRVSLFRMPQLSGPFARRFLPSPINEAVAVSHVKAMAFDDEEVLITGANLSEDYFTTRQDRYVHIQGGGGGGGGGRGRRAGGRAAAESLTGFYHDLIEVLGRYAVSPLVALSQEPGSIVDFQALRTELRQLLQGGEGPPSFLPPSSSSPPDPDVCWAMPTLQCGPLGIRHDEALLHALLASPPSSLPSSPHLTLATAYLNPPLSFLEDLRAWQQQRGREGGREEGPKLSIVSPSAATHGFAGARGVKAFIPVAYALHEQRVRKHFMPALPPALPPSLYRYTRPGWTFHGKGLWVLEEEGGREGGREGGGVALTVAGSSNYGHRSFERDLESQVWLAVGGGEGEGRMLKERMREERTALLRQCELVGGEGGGEGEGEEEEVLLRGHRRMWAPTLTAWTQGLL